MAAENHERIEFAIRQFEKYNIEYVLKNESSGHFHCRRKSDDKLFQFWAGTGKILGYDDIKGIHRLIKLLTEPSERVVKVVWVDNKTHKQVLDAINHKGEVVIETKGFDGIHLKVVSNGC